MDIRSTFSLDNLSLEEELREAQLIMLDILKEVDEICKRHNIGYWMDAGTLLGAVRHGGFIPWDDDLDIGMMREDYERFKEIAPRELSKKRFLQTCDTDKNFKNTWLKIRDRNSLLVEDMEGKLHQGVFIDIFPFDYYSENSLRRSAVENFYRHLFKITKLKHTPIKHPYLRPVNLVKNIIVNTAKLIDRISPWSDEELLYKVVKRRRFKIVDRMKRNKGSIIGYGGEVYKWRFEVLYDNVFPLSEYEFEGVIFKAPRDPDKYLRIRYGDSYMTPPPEKDRVVHSKAIKTKLTEEEYRILNEGF